MLIIIIIRVIIFVTFLLLVGEGIAAIIWATRFAARYERRHKELEVRIDVLERRESGK
jgi:hypothetical protein